MSAPRQTFPARMRALLEGRVLADLHKRQRGRALAVLLAYVAHANSKGEAWPGDGLVAGYFGIGIRTVQRGRADLVRVGVLIDTGKRHGVNGPKVWHVATNLTGHICGQSATAPDRTHSGVLGGELTGQIGIADRTDRHSRPDTYVADEGIKELKEKIAARAHACVDDQSGGRSATDNPDKATAYTFHTTTGTWTLTTGQRDKLRDAYPFVHVDTELAGLADWTETNPDRRKKPGAMHQWLRARLAQQQAGRPQVTAAFYADGFQHASLPTDPTPEQLDEILSDA